MLVSLLNITSWTIHQISGFYCAEAERLIDVSDNRRYQVCAAGSTNIDTLAARKGGSQHEYKNAALQSDL